MIKHRAFADLTAPIAIAMWDFSWLERRWPGGGYEDWDEALGALAQRGYNAVRIDAYPHLVADQAAHHTLVPVWDQNDWGSVQPITVEVRDNLAEFIRCARAHGVAVGLSTWFRRDVTEVRMGLDSPAKHAAVWLRTLDWLDQAQVLDNVLYVDLCNEWALSIWAPFLYGDVVGATVPSLPRADPRVHAWGAQAIALVRERYPQLPLTLSMSDRLGGWRSEDVSFLDFLEPHIWMTNEPSEFYGRLGYDMAASHFSVSEVDKLARGAEALYRSDEAAWQAGLAGHIRDAAEWSRATDLPLITTECWAIVNWKDRPDLPWGWVKELCEFGVLTAAATGRWAGLGTSNFCGPQFHGMWDDVAWHQRLTAAIHAAPLPG